MDIFKRWEIKRVYCLFVVAVVVHFSLYGFPVRASAEPIDDFRNALIDYFKKQNYFPVLVDRGYSIGDVIDVDGVNIYARSARCFPKLKIPKAVPITLPDIFRTKSAGMNFGLRLKRLLSANTDTDLMKQIQIKFSDVTATSVSRLELRDAYDRKACPEIAPLVDGTMSAADEKKIYFIVSELIKGKREAMVDMNTQGSIQARTQRISSLVADASLKVSAADKGLVVVKSTKVAPIAIKPLTIPKIVSIGSFDLRSEGNIELKWTYLDCPPEQVCPTKEFNSFADFIKSKKPHLSDEELEE